VYQGQSCANQDTFVPKVNMWTGFVGSMNENSRTPAAFYRNLEVARESEIPLEIWEVTAGAKPYLNSGSARGILADRNNLSPCQKGRWAFKGHFPLKPGHHWRNMKSCRHPQFKISQLMNFWGEKKKAWTTQVGRLAEFRRQSTKGSLLEFSGTNRRKICVD
jgi:hypothetical protein